MGFIYIVVNKLKIPPAVIVYVYILRTPVWPMPGTLLDRLNDTKV